MRGALLAALSWLLCCACGGGQTVAVTPTLPPANPAAVSKMAQGVEAARQSEGRQRAIGLLEEAVKADSRLWEAHYNLGVLYADAGNLAAAERALERAQELAPNAEDVAIALAEVRRRRRDSASAIEALSAFVKEHPDAMFASVALMSVLREGGKIDQAIELAHRALVKRSQDPFVLSELALAHLERDEIDTAEILVQEALKAEPKSAVAERTAGLVALKKGDDALAFQHFEQATELDPNDNTARLNIGTVLLQAGVYERAAQQFQAVHEAEPGDVAATLGLAAARRGQYKKEDPATLVEVEQLLKEVLREQPNHPAATFNLAILYADYVKRPHEATRLFRRFLDDAPKDHSARAEAEKWLSSQSAAPSVARLGTGRVAPQADGAAAKK